MRETKRFFFLLCVQVSKNMKEFFATWIWNVDEQDAFELFFLPLPFFSPIIITIIII